MLISKDEAKKFEAKPRTPKNSRPVSVAQQISDIANVDPFIKQVIGICISTASYKHRRTVSRHNLIRKAGKIYRRDVRKSQSWQW